MDVLGSTETFPTDSIATHRSADSSCFRSPLLVILGLKSLIETEDQ